MATTQNEADEIEPAEITVDLPPGGVYQMTPGLGADGQGEENEALKEEQHKISVGGEHVPHVPLSLPLVVANIIGATLALVAGATLVSLGVVLSGLISFHGNNRPVPPVWWIGILVYGWGLALLVSSLTQTVIMGWAGVFTTSHFDVWPPGKQSDEDVNVCKKGQADTMCYCLDEYQGAYSNLELPGVHYQYVNNTRWRETMFSDCDMVYIVSQVYYAIQGVWGIYLFTVVLTCIAAHIGSVCATYEDDKFQRLDEDAEFQTQTGEDDIETSPQLPVQAESVAVIQLESGTSLKGEEDLGDGNTF